MVALALLTFAPGRMGGSESYVRGLAKALAAHGRLEYVAVVPLDALDVASGLPAVAGGSPGSASRLRAFAAASVAGRALGEAVVVHYPFTVPLPRPRVPHVVTLHDVLHLDMPGAVSRGTRAYRALAYDAPARRAGRVVVPSEFVARRAADRLGVDGERIRVIPHGVDHSIFRPDGRPREPFLLYPARRWPHKNHALLFAAFAELRRHRPELELVLTGDDWSREELPAAVRSLGRVPVGELAELYRRASALVFPSRYEGFGLPVLEAMASGCPVAAAGGTAVAEVAGNAGVLFDPASADEMTEAVERVLDGSGSLAALGAVRAASFTWERAAQLHDDVYEELG